MMFKAEDFKINLTITIHFQWKLTSLDIFIFSYPYNVEEALFMAQIFEVDILMNLHDLRFPESENQIFSS